MAVITISREIGSLGTELARKLSEELQYSLMDKEVIAAALSEQGMQKPKIERFDERKPTFWDVFSSDRDKFLNLAKGVIYKFAQDGKGIILGRGGQVLLRNLGGVIHLRFTAPDSVRIKRIQDVFACDERQAVHIMRTSDKDRAGFHKMFYDVEWADPCLYDMVINTEKIGEPAVLQMIHGILTTRHGALSEEARKSLQNLVLSQTAVNTILYVEQLPIHFLQAKTQEGVVTLSGNVTVSQFVDRCEEIVAKLPGVKEVRNEIVFINGYPAMMETI